MGNKAEHVPLGSGMAGKAADTIKTRQAFKESTINAAMAGEDHPTFEKWSEKQYSPDLAKKPK